MEENLKSESEVEELKFEEPSKACEQQSLVKDYFTVDESGKIKELANLFGQSEAELKKEFGVFKAKKVYKKLNYFIDTRMKLNGDIIDMLNTATKYGFYGVTVYPTALPLAVSLLNGCGVKVRALVDYPSGESSYKAVRYALKQAVNRGADEVLVALSCYEIKNGDEKDVFKKVRKLVKRAKTKPVSVLLDTSVLSRAEVERVMNLLWTSGIYSVVLARQNGELDKNLAIECAQSYGDKINVECFDDITCSEVAVSTLLGGVNMLCSESCQDIVLDFSKKINACEVEDCQALDKTSKE
ncbi:MAG: hypothetical protein IJA97_00655 [Clostridia bacterium]|nr:hypothetical protein [Clostridia bacterium]